MDGPPWSTSQLRKLGISIRDHLPVAPTLPTYDEVLLWYNDVALAVQREIAELDWFRLLGPRSFEVTSRAKTIDTLREKLQRDHSTPLQNIQDLAGVRFEAEMTLDEQDAVAARIVEQFGPDRAGIHDLRPKPHSGYRAVHLWLRLPARAEVQIRTHLQGHWANMYEAAADVWGRSIRYDELPANPEIARAVVALREMSTVRLASVEDQRNRAEALRRENARRLHDLDQYEIDDTLPSSIGDALEIQVQIDELVATAKAEDEAVAGDMLALKRIFEAPAEGGQ